MRLLSVNSRIVGEKAYQKLRVNVNVSQDAANRLGWKEGQELEAIVRKDGLLVRSQKSPPN